MNKLDKVNCQIVNINLILKLKIMKGILFATICGITELWFQISGKMNNIKIQKEKKEIDRIEHWLCNKLSNKRKFLRRNIIIILILQIKII